MPDPWLSPIWDRLQISKELCGRGVCGAEHHLHLQAVLYHGQVLCCWQVLSFRGWTWWSYVWSDTVSAVGLSLLNWECRGYYNKAVENCFAHRTRRGTKDARLGESGTWSGSKVGGVQGSALPTLPRFYMNWTHLHRSYLFLSGFTFPDHSNSLDRPCKTNKALFAYAISTCDYESGRKTSVGSSLCSTSLFCLCLHLLALGGKARQNYVSNVIVASLPVRAAFPAFSIRLPLCMESYV